MERILPTIKSANVRLLLTAVLELERLSSRVIRLTIDEDTSAMLDDCGDPLPTLLGVFEKTLSKDNLMKNRKGCSKSRQKRT